jgi:hypothetical protein
MWFITNTRNTPILSKYNERVIRSFFELWIEISRRPTFREDINTPEFLNNQLTANLYLDPRLLSINRSGNDKILPLIKKIIRLGTTVLEREYAIYNDQNQSVNARNFNIVRLNHPQPLLKIFKDYFYDKFLAIPWIWSDIVGQEYNRASFHSNFKTENQLSVCPYCDIDTISEQRNSWVEHFLPKGKFPYISCNPNNLLPSCTSCNVSGSGKGENTRIPITTPYNHQIGDGIVMYLLNGEIEIDLHPELPHENFIQLLNLKERYKDPIVKNSIFSVLTDYYNLTLQAARRGDFDQNIFLKYIQSVGRKRGFYFAQKNLLGDIDDILTMDI